MMNWINDLGAPLAVTAIDLTVETTAPQWNEWASYIIAGGTGFMTATNRGGEFTKAMLHASIPWAAKKLYDRVRGGVSSPVRRLSLKPISRWPAPLVEEPFGGSRLI